MRETIREVTLKLEEQDYVFRLNKMDALQGGLLAKFLMEKVLPGVQKLQNLLAVSDEESKEDADALAKQKTDSIFSAIPELLANISDDDLMNLEKKCLATVECKMPAGWIPVFNGKHFNIPDLEYDVLNTLLLCYHVLEFNVSGFFPGRGLASILNLPVTPPQNA